MVLSNGLVESLIVQLSDVTGELELLLGLDATLLSDEGTQALQITTRLVIDRLIALSIKVLQGRETLNTESLAQRPLSVGVNLGDLDLVLGMFKCKGELLVDGSKSLAVSTPRGKEFDESRLAGLKNDLVKVGR